MNAPQTAREARRNLGLSQREVARLMGVSHVYLAAFLIFRVKQSVEQVEPTPLSAEDRLHISIALRHLESAYKEIGKAAWLNSQPGNPRVLALYQDLIDAERLARRIMHEEA